MTRSAKRIKCWSELPAHVKVRFVDFHAEVPAKKLRWDGTWMAASPPIVGTHTHVPTADTRILPGGTGVSDGRRHDGSLYWRHRRR